MSRQHVLRHESVEPILTSRGQEQSKQASQLRPPHPLLRLQQIIGNRAVGRLLQAKLTISQPDDKYEQEADRVADQVMHMSQPGFEHHLDEDESEKILQTEPVRLGWVTQEENNVEVPPIVHEVLQSPGRPLDKATRAFMEAHFGYDFSRVHVHTDARAAESAQAVNAFSYTVGNDIVFGTGEYAPESPVGERLLAHELTHVMQQRNTQVPNLVQRRRRGQHSSTGEQVTRDEYERLRSRVAQQEFISEQLDLRQRVHLAIHEFEEVVERRGLSWQMAAKRIGTAYATAVDRHQEAIRKQERRDALRNELIFSLVLTPACAFGLSWMSTSIQKKLPKEKPVTELIANASEDAAQALAAGGIGFAKASLLPSSQTALKIPLVFQNELELKIMAALKESKMKFAEFYRCVNYISQIFTQDSIDRIEYTMLRWLLKTAQFCGDENLPSDKEMTDELERGIWARWASNLVEVVPAQVTPSGFIPGHVNWKYPGEHLEDRFDALEITTKSGVGNFGWYTTPGEVELLYNYLTHYEVRSFLDLPK